MVITTAKLRMAHASTHGARKPPGPISCVFYFQKHLELGQSDKWGKNYSIKTETRIQTYFSTSFAWF